MPKPTCQMCQKARSTTDDGYCNRCREESRRMTAPVMVPLSKIRIDGGTQTRVKIPEHRIVEYVEALVNGEQFPPIVLYFDGCDHWIADGFTRYFAHKRGEKKEILATVRTGERRDALRFALSANATHGEPRTNDDKRKAVGLALADSEWSKLPDAELAALCKVSRSLVHLMRRELAGKPSYPSHADRHPGPESTSAEPATDEADPDAEEAEDDHSQVEDPEPERSPEPRPIPRVEQPPPRDITDALGIPVKGDALRKRFAVREQARRVRSLLRDTSSLINEICQGPGGERLAIEVGAKVKGQTVSYRSHYVQQLLQQLEMHIPHVCVCPQCYFAGRKKPDATCPTCKGLGYLTKQQWLQVPPDQQAEILEQFQADANHEEDDL